jgi:hypothetical protein
MNDEVATREDTIRVFVERSKRHWGVGIRQSFLQRGRGRASGPGILADFVRRRDALALDLYLMLLLRGRGAKYGGHFINVQAGTWARALGLGSASADQVLSRALRRLEARRLIRRTKTQRGVRVELLRDDGSGEKYSPPGGRKDDPYFQLPLEYWRADHYMTLGTPGKAMLLIALGEMEEFELPVARVPSWYGVSQETALRGFEELVRASLALYDQRSIKDPMHPAGKRLAKVWRLLDPYARPSSAVVEAEPRLRRVK